MNCKNILITAGPTRERIDPVRFISNRSSGKMGYALAKAAEKLCKNVTLISGPVNLTPPDGINVIQVESAEEMACEVRKAANSADLIIMAAAVADYRPKSPSDSKIKKSDSDMAIELERTTDILAELGKEKGDKILAGFAAETDNVIKNAKEKLARKNLDWIIANDVSRSDAGFQSETNEVTMISKNGNVIELPLQKKEKLAELILKNILNPFF
jgi:phosphopantothenoylcysteine decarboxylase/phosphopantothenate--cysteine ligase